MKEKWREKIEEIVTKMVEEEKINIPEISVCCPFRVYGKFKCVYMKKGMCTEIDINPANSDSFCGGIVEPIIRDNQRYNDGKLEQLKKDHDNGDHELGMPPYLYDEDGLTKIKCSDCIKEVK